MSDDTRTIEEIEAELGRDRAALNANLSALQERLSLKGVAQEALGLFGGAGAGKASAAALSGTPIAALAIGAGLGWLASGKGKGGAGSSTTAATLAAATAAQVISAMEPEDIRAVAKEIDQIYRAGAERLQALQSGMRDKAEGAAAYVARRLDALLLRLSFTARRPRPRGDEPLHRTKTDARQITAADLSRRKIHVRTRVL